MTGHLVPLTLNSFETALAQLFNAVNSNPSQRAIDHIVINCTSNLQETVQSIKEQIKKSKPSQLLYGIDLRPVIHHQGNQGNWSLEGCSKSQSLATIGLRPTS